MRSHRSHQLKQLQERTLMSRRYMRSFMRFVGPWGLDCDDVSRILGLSKLHSIAGWRSSWQDLVLTEAQLEKVSYLMVINKLLMNHFDSDKGLKEWLNAQNEHPLFLEKRPLECFMDSTIHQLNAISEWMLSEWG